MLLFAGSCGPSSETIIGAVVGVAVLAVLVTALLTIVLICCYKSHKKSGMYMGTHVEVNMSMHRLQSKDTGIQGRDFGGKLDYIRIFWGGDSKRPKGAP